MKHPKADLSLLFFMFVDHTKLDINTCGIPLNEWSASRRGNYLHSTQQIQGMNIHTLRGIRTRDHSSRAAGPPEWANL